MSFFFNGVELTREDFGDDLRAWVAFNIAFTAATACGDKEAALGMLDHTAAEIIKRVKSDHRNSRR